MNKIIFTSILMIFVYASNLLANEVNIFSARPLAPKFKLRLETELSPTKNKTKKTPNIIEKV